VDRLLEQDLSASRFGAAVADPLPNGARTVVVGGGIVGASVSYHLAMLGHTDVLLLEGNTIGSGTSWHAAGLVSSVRATPALTELAAYGTDLYRRLGELADVDVSFNQCGSLVLARTSGRMDELRYTHAIARQAGIEAELLAAGEVTRLWPLASAEGLHGALLQSRDGHVNPGLAMFALAKLAHEGGVAIRENVRVRELLVDSGAVVGVSTDRGDVRCERVVIAAGLWTRDLAASAGINVPLYAAEHAHVRTAPIPGVVGTLPVLRDLDGYTYIRTEGDCLLVGAFEPDGKPRAVAGIGHRGFARFPADWDHFAGVRAKAEERVPALRSTTYERFLNAPESFTPDALSCLGEAAEVRGVYVAAGFNSQGIIYAPGAGRALAEWITEGAPTFDASSVDVRRFARMQGNRRYLHERTHESLGRLYAMHWPHLQPATARMKRLSPLHDRLATANACFGETAGWERANWFAPGPNPSYEYSYGRQNWFEASAAEHRAARAAVAVFDLSSFAKVEVAGPDALAVVQALCTANLDVPPGKIVYTLMANARGGIELDGTVTRLDADRFLIVTQAAAQTKTIAAARRAAHGRAAAAFDATSGLATIAVMGPRSRDLIARISPQDWSNGAQPYTWAREVEIADAFAWALRVSYVGELGYELYVPTELAGNVFDALTSAGEDLGLRLAGYHALDSLRVEKGYRHLGHDIGPDIDPYDAGLGFTVSLDKPGPFVGSDALRRLKSQRRTRRVVYVALSNPAAHLVDHETLLANGRPVGRLTSGSYGHTLGRACGLATVGTDVDLSGAFEVDCGGTREPAEISVTPFYDPSGDRLRA
jgi:glycine cleavage system aminomethyltransferase T/glycine/D-amino acid oxidase-like deaminating enzyme